MGKKTKIKLSFKIMNFFFFLLFSKVIIFSFKQQKPENCNSPFEKQRFFSSSPNSFRFYRFRIKP